jgi:HK97 family phage prohead protease
MQIQIRADKVILDGYVNAVERLSKPIPDRKGKFREKIQAGAFQRALDRVDNVPILLDHDKNRQLAQTNDGTATLYEDNIGLRAIMETSDSEVMQKAKEGKLRGWSFGFYANDQEYKPSEDGIEERTVKDLDLTEVSLIDDRKTPAYIATSVEVRDDSEKIVEYREQPYTECTSETISKRIARYYADGTEESETITVDKYKTQHVDLSEYDNRINALKSAE